MLEEQAKMELIHDDRYPGRAGSAHASDKTFAFASRLVRNLGLLDAHQTGSQFPDRSDDLHRFLLGHAHQPGHFPFSLLACALAGTLLVASGTGTLNQWANSDGGGRRNVPFLPVSGSREDRPSHRCLMIRHSAVWVRGPSRGHFDA
jgi:hypothetical protein